jgi:hypothetical protein
MLSEIGSTSVFSPLRLSQSHPINRIVLSLYSIAGLYNSNYNNPNTTLYILVLVISNIIFSV